MTLPPLRARTLGAVLERNARLWGERTFLLDDAGSLSWGAVFTRAQEVAAGFSALGVGHGDPVVIALNNRREFVEAWFGLATLGAIEVPADPRAGRARLLRILAHSEAAVAVIEPELVGLIVSLADDLPRLRTLVIVGSSNRLDVIDVVDGVDGVPFKTVPFAELTGPLVAPDLARETDPVAVMYTSGSTGQPKGVVLPQGQHFTNGRQAVHAAGIRDDDTVFLCLPLSHNMAQGYGIWPALLVGAAVKLVPRFDRHTFWAQVAESRATVLPFVGDLIVILAKAAPSAGDSGNSLRVGYGVPIPTALHQAFEDRFGLELVHAYGSTEATIPVWSTGPDRMVGAAGTVVDGFDVQIRGSDGRPLSTRNIGEIWVRASAPDMMFTGYFRDPARTTQALRDGWFHTGDQGEFDDAGRLWFRGRAGDAIRHHGEFVDATEIESAALHHPDVVQAAAFAVASELADDDIMLSVVGRPGGGLTAAGLRTWLTAQLPKFAVPRYVDLISEMPMTANGKIEKFKLKARGVTASSDDGRVHSGGSR